MECLQLKCHPFLFSKQLHLFVVHNKKNQTFLRDKYICPWTWSQYTWSFLKAEWCWIQSLVYCQVLFSVPALWLQNSSIIYNAIRWSTKNSRRIKPDTRILKIFPVLKVNALMASFSLLTPHWTALTLGKSYSQGDVLLVKKWLF